MKRLLLFTFCFFPFVSFGQVKSGKITYHTKIIFTVPAQGLDAQIQRNQEIPEVKWLRFNETAYTFASAPREYQIPAPLTLPDGREVITYKGNPDVIQHYDFQTREGIENMPLNYKDYLVKKDITSSNWSLTGETKTILNLSCEKAVREDIKVFSDSTTMKIGTVTAWFTKEIPVGVAPEFEVGLEGAILEMTIERRELKKYFIATKIEYPMRRASRIEKPKQGELISENDFQELLRANFRNTNTHLLNSQGATPPIKRN